MSKDQLAPGPELGAAIAARELDAKVWLALEGRPGDILTCRYVDGDVQPHAGYPIGHISPPHYSTDWGAAGQVVERLSGRGFDFCLDKMKAKGEWYAGFIRSDIGDITSVNPPWLVGTAPTAPHAICLAAQAALEGDK